MKTAISIPDSLFREGEKLAHKLKIKRSDLYREALTHYLTLHEEKSLIEKLNSVYSHEENTADRALQQLQVHALKQSEW